MIRLAWCYAEPFPTLEQDPYGLLSMIGDRFIVTPHCAYLTDNSMRNMLGMAANSIQHILSGHSDPYIVNPVYANVAITADSTNH
jgi:lactate dehydrogenase-like 2-hydroxyacid dehydrogenase